MKTSEHHFAHKEQNEKTLYNEQNSKKRTKGKPTEQVVNKQFQIASCLIQVKWLSNY